MAEQKKSARQVHVEALKQEKAMLTSRPDSDTKTRRLAEVDVEIKKYSRNPAGAGGREIA